MRINSSEQARLELRKERADFHISRRLAIIIILVVIAFVPLEIYAHSCVSVHHLPPLTEDEALNLVPSPHNGSQTFSSGGTRWLAVYRVTKPTSSANFVYVYLFKIDQNGGLFVQSTDIAICGLEPSSNATRNNFHADIKEILSLIHI